MSNSKKSLRSSLADKFVYGFDELRVLVVFFKLFPDIFSFIHTDQFNLTRQKYLKLSIFIALIFLFSPLAYAARLPIVGGDVDLWGDVLNDYLVQQHNASGGHINVTTDNLNVTNTAILARDSGRVGIATTAPITALDVRGNLNVTGFGNFSILQLVTGGTLLFPNNIITAAMVQTLNGTKITDIVQSMVFGGGNRTWGNLTFSNSSTVNWTWGSSLQNPTVSAEYRNESLFNLDTRQKNDNASVARTNVQNTFAASQIIQGNLNVTGQINATNYTSTTFKVASCDIKADAGGSLYCGTDANTGVSNATAFTDVVQSIMAGGANRAWGNATIATGSFLTISQSAGLINPTLTIAGVSNL
ncbi:MAG: hypothetical protein HYU56_01110, partial [Candidatus Aenigmarchaeota archaeon]|nr:hypothetical protein [Candidatus Aenigmarchaeota archaeon]